MANQIKVAQNGINSGNRAHMIRVEKKTSASVWLGYMHFKLTKCCPMTAVEKRKRLKEKKIENVRENTERTQQTHHYQLTHGTTNSKNINKNVRPSNWKSGQ